jgi:single-strand DNA-binding protein
MSDNTITITGNVVADPEIRYTPSGHAVANFRVASTARYYDANAKQWQDAGTTFISVTAWRTLASNVAESVTKGCRVVVVGRLVQRTWENEDREKQYRYEIDADEVAASMRMTTVTINRATRTGPVDAHTTQPAEQNGQATAAA